MENKEIIVSIKADTSGISESINEVKSSLKDLGGKDIAGKSVQSLKTQLREANVEAQKIGETFGYNSKQFAKAAKEVAEIKDKFDEYKQTVASFNPDNKLQAVVNLGKGITGAMQGAVGGFAALGIEGEKNEEIIRRLQGLMAFSSALNSIDDIKNSFKNFGLVLGLTNNKVKENTVAIEENVVASETSAVATEGMAVATKGASVATNTLGTAFKALGIGLIISAIAYLVSNWDDLKESVTKLFPFLDGIGDKFNKLVDIAKGVGNAIINYISTPFKAIAKIIQGDFKGAIDEVKKGFDVVGNFKEGFNKAEADREKEHQKELLEVKIGADKRKLEALKASGKDTYQLEKQLANEEASLAKTNAEKILKNRKELSAEEISDLSKDNREKYDKFLDANGKILQVEAAHQKKLKELREKENEAIKQQKEKHDALLKQLNDYITATDGITKEALERAKNQFKTEREVELNNAKIDADGKNAALKKSFEDEKLALQKGYEERIKIEGTDKKLSIIREKEFTDGKAKINTAYLGASNALTNEAKAKEAEINKKYADKINDYLKGINAQQLSAFGQERDKINKEINDLLKNATDAEKKLLESSRTKQLDDVTKKETLYTNTVSSSTNLINTKTSNIVTDKDGIEERKAKLLAINAAEIQAEQAAYTEKLNNLKGNQADIEALTAEHNNKLAGFTQAQSDIDKAAAEAKVSTITGALGNVATLVGENTVAGKSLAIAQATIDTYTGATKAFAQGGVFGYVGAAGVIAAGIANVKKIVDTKIPNTSGGSGSTPSISSGSAPIINPAALNPLANQVQDVRVTNQSNQSVRAYITNKDIKDNSTRNDFLNNLNSFG